MVVGSRGICVNNPVLEGESGDTIRRCAQSCTARRLNYGGSRGAHGRRHKPCVTTGSTKPRRGSVRPSCGHRRGRSSGPTRAAFTRATAGRCCRKRPAADAGWRCESSWARRCRKCAQFSSGLDEAATCRQDAAPTQMHARNGVRPCFAPMPRPRGSPTVPRVTAFHSFTSLRTHRVGQVWGVSTWDCWPATGRHRAPTARGGVKSDARELR